MKEANLLNALGDSAQDMVAVPRTEGDQKKGREGEETVGGGSWETERAGGFFLSFSPFFSGRKIFHDRKKRGTLQRAEWKVYVLLFYERRTNSSSSSSSMTLATLNEASTSFARRECLFIPPLKAWVASFLQEVDLDLVRSRRRESSLLEVGEEGEGEDASEEEEETLEEMVVEIEEDEDEEEEDEEAEDIGLERMGVVVMGWWEDWAGRGGME